MWNFFWLKIANQKLEVTRQFLWLHSDSSRASHDSSLTLLEKILDESDSTVTRRLVTLTRKKLLGHITVVSICILSGDGGWQVRDVDVEKGCQDRSLRDVVLEASYPAFVSSFASVFILLFPDCLEWLYTVPGFLLQGALSSESCSHDCGLMPACFKDHFSWSL